MRLLTLCVVAAVPIATADAEPVDFDRDVAPILAEHCLGCHQGTSDDVGGGLWLDHARGLRIGGDSGPAVIAHDPDASPLIQAVRYESFEMPPDGRLTDAEVATLTRWVEEGGADPRSEIPAEARHLKPTIDVQMGRRFWAFQPVADVTVPPGTTVHPIDRFLVRKLTEADVVPEPAADPATLLRRVHFALTGLPPSPGEVSQFVSDHSEAAYAAVVDRLLQSPAFGEHWGRHWLDLARYSDSNGSDFNATRHNAWRYRDYVIDSFNDDRPYDEFVRQQIAGDLLAAGSRAERTDAIVAAGFLALGPKMLSERDKEKLRMDVVDEQVDTIGKTFLGLTLGCARCHDHKFDPVPQTDYYALAGIFRSTQTLEGEIQQYVSDVVRTDLPMEPDHAAALARFDAELGELQSQRKAAEKRLATRERRVRADGLLGEGIVIDNAQAEFRGEWKLSSFSNARVGPDYRHNDKNISDGLAVTYRATLPPARYEVRVSFSGGGSRASNVPVTITDGAGVVASVVLDQSRTPKLESLFASLGQFDLAGESTVTLQTEGTNGYVIADAVQFVDLAARNRVSDDEQLSGVAAARAEVKAIEVAIARLQSRAPKPAPVALTVRDEPVCEDCTMRIRGEVHLEGPPQPRGVLQVASFQEPPTFSVDESGRRELADWIAHPDHPLTARVYANRIWLQLFGEGLVRTPDNFGKLGERPTHPELLDYLAGELVDAGWSTKSLIRSIVLSDAFRRASSANLASERSDPENRLLWRAHRRPLSAEQIRDTLLLVSGQLNRGRRIEPLRDFGKLVNKNNGGKSQTVQEESFRSVYEPIIRNELRGTRTLFDFADPDVVVGRRPKTNVPSQVLYLLNSSDVRDAATRIADRCDADPDRVYLLLLSRHATPGEAERLSGFADRTSWVDAVHTMLASTSFRLLE